MRLGQAARRLVAAGLWGGTWVAALEIGALWYRYDVSGVALVWLGAATWSLSVCALACATALWLPAMRLAGQHPRVAKLGNKLRQGAARWLGGAAALGLSAALHVANVSLYVRLYTTQHVLLSIATLLTAHWGCALLAQPRDEGEAASRSTRTFALAAIMGVLGVMLVSVGNVLSDVALRSHALEQATTLAHELLALDRVSGVLAATEQRTVGTLDPEVRAALEPQPVKPSSMARGANVLLVTVDSLRSDRWLAGGAARPLMPTLEALGSQGVRFARAYAPSCWTIHSMTSVLFERLPSQLRFTPVGVNADYRFIPFRAEDAQNPLNFKRMTPVPFTEQGPSLIDQLKSAGYQTATVAAYIFYFRAAGLTADFEHVDEEGYKALGFGASGIAPVPMVERALRFLGQRDPSRPFFLWLHFMEPHAPYEAHDAMASSGGKEARYDSELRYVDAQLASLREGMRKLDLDDNTLWIVHADHGEEFGDHGGSFHASSLYEEIVRVPLLVRLPRALGVAPRVVQQPVSLLDLGPTLRDLLGLGGEGSFMGRSLRPSLLEGAQPARPILMECERFAARKRAYVRWPFKLIVDRATGTAQLFALPGDPRERDNLVGREPAVLELMAGELTLIERSLL